MAIVDGTGTDAYSGSIRIEGDRITQVGDALAPQQGDVLIDAAGLIVAPGFIDMHAHVSNIHEYPQAENFLRQGVITPWRRKFSACGYSWILETWACISIKPGATIKPAASMSTSPCCGASASPTCVIRSPSILILPE